MRSKYEIVSAKATLSCHTFLLYRPIWMVHLCVLRTCDDINFYLFYITHKMLDSSSPS
jgi:hypothetical protein